MSQPIPLFQFWHDPNPPEEVAELMRTWEEDADFDYRRFDHDSADAYLVQHYDEKVVSAYRQCGVPAMQADFFRYCVVLRESGVYVDADTYNGGGLGPLCRSVERGIMMQRGPKITNDFFFFKESGDPMLEYAVRRATRNIEQRISNNVHRVTGPSIFIRLWTAESEESRKLFDGIDVISNKELRKIVRPQWKMDYKEQESDWRHAKKQNISIFTDG